MTHTEDEAWGADPTPRYDALAQRFRPLFQRIRDGALERERERRLLSSEIGWLKEAGFTSVRIPEEEGGAGATLPEFFALLVELSAADSNVTQALRAHFGFVEELLHTAVPERRGEWVERVVRGEIVGSARSEAGDAAQAAFDTTLSRTADTADTDGADTVWRIDGRKFYTTGSLYADWLHVATTRAEDGASVTALVARNAPGVAVIDDWNGFGQRLTASGTATFDDARVPARHVVDDASIFSYALPFYQLVHLATLAGIGRAAANELAHAVARRRRGYSHGAAALPHDDPQILQVVGRVRSAAYAARAIVLGVAFAIERATRSGDARAALDPQLVNIAEIESAQAVGVVSNLILEASGVLFDALGASAISRDAALDRHWRNARTLISHNPRIYKERIVGDFAVNGTAPPNSWRVGRVASNERVDNVDSGATL